MMAIAMKAAAVFRIFVVMWRSPLSAQPIIAEESVESKLKLCFSRKGFTALKTQLKSGLRRLRQQAPRLAPAWRRVLRERRGRRFLKKPNTGKRWPRPKVRGVHGNALRDADPLQQLRAGLHGYRP